MNNKSRYDSVIEFIEEKHQIKNNSKFFTLYFNNEINYYNNDNEILEFLKESGS